MGDNENDDTLSPPGSPRMRVRNVFRSQISYLCAALGGFEQIVNDKGESVNTYVVGFECLGCLKDLKRFWRMDEQYDDRPISRILHEINVLETDLIPIMKHMLGTSEKGNRMALACADLINAMTWPIDILAELKEAHETDQDVSDIDFVGLLNAQRHCKAVILRTGCIPTLFQIMYDSLAKSKKDRSRRDDNIITLIVSIFRNLAAIQDPPPASNTSTEYQNYSALQTELIIQYEKHKVLELVATIASVADTAEFASWNMLCLEMLYLLYRGVKPETLLKDEKTNRADNLAALLKEEDKAKSFGLRKGSSRHSRFGTTLSLETNGKRLHIHKQKAVGTSAAKSIDEHKKNRAKRNRQNDDLKPTSELSVDGLVVLSRFAKSFLDTAFNTFFATVQKDIRLERPFVREYDHQRMMSLGGFFLQYFLLKMQSVQTDNGSSNNNNNNDEKPDFGLISEMMEEHTFSYVLKRMTICIEDRPPSWTQYHVAMDFFTQLLLTLDALTISEDEMYQEVGTTLQHKLYYQEATLDTVVLATKKFSNQSRSYLESLIRQNYVILKLLEKYSKSNGYTFIRRKKKRVRQRRPASRDDGDDDDGEDDGQRSYEEHRFHFTEFEKKFADDAVVKTYITYLSGYRDFTSDQQVRYIVNLMHRQSVRSKSVALFFRVSILEIFDRILEDEKLLPKTSPYTDLHRFIIYILAKFFKSIRNNQLVQIEAFFPHRKSDLNRLGMYTNDIENGDNLDSSNPKSIRVPAELEIKQGFTETQNMGIAVGLLQEKSKESLVEWIKDVVRTCASMREELIITIDGPEPTEPLFFDEEETDEQIRQRQHLKEKGPSEEAKAMIEPYEVEYETDEQKVACTKDADFRLLLRTLKWEDHEDLEASCVRWTIPASLLPAQLRSFINILDKFLIDPLMPEDGKPVSEHIRKKRKPQKRRIHEEDEFVDLDDLENTIIRRNSKKKDEMANYKSAQFIDSDDDADDEERDRAFFAREADLRARIDAGQIPASSGTKKRKVKKKSSTAEADDNNVVNDDFSPTQTQDDVADVEETQDDNHTGRIRDLFGPDLDSPEKVDAPLFSPEDSASPVVKSAPKRRRNIIDDEDEE